ncbi:MAG: fasciclin domain-containing protein [Tsuneonella suprasediminis]|uniref:Fasciclin domain-containing protein n=1 Tax=Tsuneonella suprasediminis TaxID=2306996 RepID=A0A419R331_9SPHN|nr:fasciclin domain-containing protein [Tsuneonella suprasediminis]RJX68565.1 fasciclin domain-containing protein [Tsuneonella suprasediminis]UBS31674.1 fasciclin domain-containing protein [Altererythrobacter sp. N1]
MKNAKMLGTAALVGLMVPLAACSGGGEETSDKAKTALADKTTRTLASVIAGQNELSQVSDAMAEAGLAGVFDGPGSYTVLVPENSAFDELGEAGKTLTDAAHRPELVAVLRDHILPGALTAKAIETAIAENNGSVEMRTMGGDTVTFTQEDSKILVTGADGSRATLDGQAIVASNGVAMPISGLLKKAAPSATTQQ